MPSALLHHSKPTTVSVPKVLSDKNVHDSVSDADIGRDPLHRAVKTLAGNLRGRPARNDAL